MGHARAIRDNLLELEQAAQRLTWPPHGAPPPVPPIIAGEDEPALPLRVPLPDLLPEVSAAHRIQHGLLKALRGRWSRALRCAKAGQISA